MGSVMLQVTLILLCVTVILASNRTKRLTGDQAPSGQCMPFYLGGWITLHWYVCCNNCEYKDSTCDGKTYHSASTYSYCDACGTDSKDGNGYKGNIFGCGGCSKQNRILNKCTSNFRSIYNLPGLCWAFVDCFSYYCTSSRKRSVYDEIPPSMFNLVCDPGEDVNTNPTDCCGTVNEKCNYKKYDGGNECPQKCCSEPSCCLTGGARKHISGSLPFFAAAIWVTVRKTLIFPV